jgi:hypothetical protein
MKFVPNPDEFLNTPDKRSDSPARGEPRVISFALTNETLQSSMEGDVRQLKELRLWEISVVTFPMNESATISSVKSLALSDGEVQHHLRAIRRHQKAIHGHVKALLGADELDDDITADELEGSDSEADDVESKALLVELQKLVAQAGELASA